VFSVAIYLGSYLPLSLILLTQDVRYEFLGALPCLPLKGVCELPLKNPIHNLVAISVCAGGLVASLFTLHLSKPKDLLEVHTAKHVPADLMNYVLPYVVSFMGLTYGEPEKVAGFLVFLVWIFLITNASGHIIMNPVLTVFGWKLYELEFSYASGSGQTFTKMALARFEPEPHERRAHATLQDVLILGEAR